jgi:hypothetical protein
MFPPATTKNAFQERQRLAVRGRLFLLTPTVRFLLIPKISLRRRWILKQQSSLLRHFALILAPLLLKRRHKNRMQR